jgi:hypothetical protein
MARKLLAPALIVVWLAFGFTGAVHNALPHAHVAAAGPSNENPRNGF